MNPRNPSLDVLRGVAVLMVVLSHYAYFPVLGKLAIGVDLFFVLSGFLISGLLFSELETKNTFVSVVFSSAAASKFTRRSTSFC